MPPWVPKYGGGKKIAPPGSRNMGGGAKIIWNFADFFPKIFKINVTIFLFWDFQKKLHIFSKKSVFFFSRKKADFFWKFQNKIYFEKIFKNNWKNMLDFQFWISFFHFSKIKIPNYIFTLFFTRFFFTENSCFFYAKKR